MDEVSEDAAKERSDGGRFDRQVRFAPLGTAGQARLEAARVLVVGCGALGGALALSLHRAGVGQLVLVDRDVVEESNLPRQVLFDAAHAERRTAKVTAARETLERAGGPTRIETHAAHLDADLLVRLGRGVDLVLDGTDNLKTRYLVNDWAVRRGVPWIYGGVVGSSGLVMAVLPGGPCLRCLFPEPAPAGTLATCDSAGVLQPAVAAIAAIQAGLALRTLVGDGAAIRGKLTEIDVWSGSARTLELAQDPGCPCCVGREFKFLVDQLAQRPEVLCGRNAVQVPSPSGTIDLDELAARLGRTVGGDVVRSGELLRFAVDDLAVTVFADGRALVEGTEDVERALALCDRWLA